VIAADRNGCVRVIHTAVAFGWILEEVADGGSAVNAAVYMDAKGSAIVCVNYEAESFHIPS
jgi:hypothetical protein